MTLNTRTRLGLLLAVLLAAGGIPGFGQEAARPAGHWEGTIKVPGQELAISVDLFGGAGGSWDGVIAIPAQNVKGLPLSNIVVKDAAVGFAMKGIPGDPRFAGTLSKDGNTIAGDFSQGAATLPFTLVWKGEARRPETPKSTAITKDFEGEWEGALDVNGTMLRLVLKLSTADGVAKGSVVSLDQGGSEIPIAAIVQTLLHLRLDVTAVGATYEGDFKDGQITGTWTQGGGSLPLTFKRRANQPAAPPD